MQLNNNKTKPLIILLGINHLFVHSEVSSSISYINDFICSVKLFQVFVFNINNSIHHESFICTVKWF